MTSKHYNLILEGVEECAAGITIRLIRSGAYLSVYVRDGGYVLTERVNDDRPEMVVGTYNKRCKLMDIVDDLRFRLQELLREDAA